MCGIVGLFLKSKALEPQLGAKQLREWETQNWLRLERGGLTLLSPDALAAIAGNED